MDLHMWREETSTLRVAVLVSSIEISYEGHTIRSARKDCGMSSGVRKKLEEEAATLGCCQ